MAQAADDNPKDAIKEAVRQFVEARLRGEEPDADELAKKYPASGDGVRKGIRELRKIDALFDSLVKAEASDFAETAREHDLVGRKIRSFEILELIGRGGMGVVYRAQDTKLNRSVAMKGLPASLSADSTARTRFRREAQLLASLNHPNVAVIHDTIESEEGAGYLVLEYVPGETLAERIVREPLGLDEALSINRQVAEAVAAAHEKGIVHRDLKPGNIKITPEGRVKVLDFGLAKLSAGGGTAGEVTATQPGHVLGTPAYMSPEQARGKEADHRTDIWSFGCILYQTLTGRLPFEGETATDVLAHVIEREPDWQRLPAETPEAIRTLLRHCLEKDPDRRLGDIRDAERQIAEALNSPSPPSTTISPGARRTRAIVAAAAIVLVLALAGWLAVHQQAPPPEKEIRLVVLPLENLGAAETERFADGMTDEITARLAGIQGLGVISRQSAMQYKDVQKGTRQIAAELGVDYILEGTIHCERPSDPNARVRIKVQLVNAETETPIWGHPYDKHMSDIFRVQADVAERVAQALDITLLEPVRRRLATAATGNMQAYDFFLRGNESFGGDYNITKNVASSVEMYEQATRLDPQFALAFARLSEAHTRMYWFRHDRSKERLAMAGAAADKALELDPDMPEAHMALGRYYYQGYYDYDRAMEHLKTAQRSQPSNGHVLLHLGTALRRQGNFEEALEYIRRASELNPLSSERAREVGVTLMYLRRYREAEPYLERAVRLAPERLIGYDSLAQLCLRGQGDNVKARAVLEEAVPNLLPEEMSMYATLLFNVDYWDDHYQQALDRLSLIENDLSGGIALLRARAYGRLGNKTLEQANYESARAILEDRKNKDPEDPRWRTMLGLAYASLGRKKEAILEGTRAVELLPEERDAMLARGRIKNLARIYMMVGDHDSAIDHLGHLLEVPSRLSKDSLRANPIWDPLREHPRFKKLIASEE